MATAPVTTLTMPCIVGSESDTPMPQIQKRAKMSASTAKITVLGLSAPPQAFVMLEKAAQVTAALAGRAYVIPEDVQYVAPHVLCHRLSSGGGARSAAAADFLKRILASVPVPLEET